MVITLFHLGTSLRHSTDYDAVILSTGHPGTRYHNHIHSHNLFRSALVSFSEKVTLT